MIETKANHEVPGYAKISGILALIFAILGFIVPVMGVLLLAPLAIIFGIIGLYGGSKAMGIATIIINAVNFFVSPSFWLNIGAGATHLSNKILAYFDIIGIIVMLYLVIRKVTKKTA